MIKKIILASKSGVRKKILNENDIDSLFDLNKVMININKIYKRLGLKK